MGSGRVTYPIRINVSAADLATVVGGIAAILAVWRGGLEGVAWFWRRRTQSYLKRELTELYSLDQELCKVAVEVDYQLAEGLDWAGWEVWPDSLAFLLGRLERLAFELDGMRARVRAQWAEGPIERLRDDIEQLVSSLRRATNLYRRGTIDAYWLSQGEPLGWSASGRAPTHALSDDEAREEVGKLRQTARLLFRSSAYQLDLKDVAEREDVALWPLLERDSLSLREGST